MSNAITPTVFCRTVNVGGLEIFYREAAECELMHRFLIVIVAAGSFLISVMAVTAFVNLSHDVVASVCARTQ